MIDEGTLRERFPEIPWDQPVPVNVPSHKPWYVCRYCIAVHGLKATDLTEDRVEYAFRYRDAALDHIEATHHE